MLQHIRKFSIIVILLVLMLIGCTEKIAVPEQPDMKDFVTFELGGNFTDHMWAIAASQTEYEGYVHEKIDINEYQKLAAWYEMLYTNRVDYLYPQIFYFIPNAHNFNSRKSWDAYFDHWIKALKERDYDYVSQYVEGLSMERFVKEQFKTMDDALWQIRFVNQVPVLEEMKTLFGKAFDSYYKDVWPDASFALLKKSTYVNEALSNLFLRQQWETQTKMSFETSHIQFNLSMVDHSDFDYVSVTDDLVILYVNEKEDPYEFSELISQRMGYILIKQEAGPVFSEIFNRYYPLENDYNLYAVINDVLEFTCAQYNRYILGYETEIYKHYLDSKAEMAYLRFNIPPPEKASERFEADVTRYLDRLRDRKPYMYKEGLYFKGQMYYALTVKDNLVLHYKEGFPMVADRMDQYTFVTGQSDSEPILSLDHSRMAFISPYLWEVIGNLYVFDFASETLTQLTDLAIGDQETIMKVEWLNDETLLLTKGFAYGTVTMGGQLYTYSLKTNEMIMRPVIPNDRHYQITDFKIEDQTLILEYIVYDESYREYAKKTKKVSIESWN